MTAESLSDRCYSTLQQNTVMTADGYHYTAPDRTYYGHQWLWDSALTAEAWAINHPYRAADEIDSLLERGQWRDGMVPNMVLQDGRAEALFMKSERNPDAPRDHATSGITQPPLLAEAAWEIAKNLPYDDRERFLAHSLGRIARYHEWWYQTRDFDDDGLVSVMHPYETGMDNNPALTEHMSSIDWRVPDIAIGALRIVVAVTRQDIKRFPAEERAQLDPTTYATLATLRLRHISYDPARLSEEPFRVQDVHTISILARNNDILAEMAAESGEHLSDFLLHKTAQTHANLEQLWDDEHQMYFSRDGITGKPIRAPTIASLMPLYAGNLPSTHTQALLDHLRDPSSFGTTPVGVPSTPMDSPLRRRPGYWDGLVWSFTDHLLADGAIRAGADSTAETIDRGFVGSVAQHGAYENFSPESGNGHGTANFSPSAALALVIINRRGDILDEKTDRLIGSYIGADERT